MKENIFSNNQPKKYLYKTGNKYFYPKNYYKKYYTPVLPGSCFSSGKKKKMYIENGKYIHIIKPPKPPKPSDFFGPPLPPVLLSPLEPRLLLSAPVRYGQRGPIPYGYYYRHGEKVKQKMRDKRLAFNKTLPPLNLICKYCNKPFVLPGMKENGHKQQPVKYCSSVCLHRSGRLRALRWIPKWLYNFYLNKKLYYIKISFRRRKHWTLKLLLSSDKNRNFKLKKFLRRYWWWDESNRKKDEYNVIKKYYTYCVAFFLLGRFKFCTECSKPFAFIASTRPLPYNYKNHISQRIRKYKTMKLYGSRLVPKEHHRYRGRQTHCSLECARKRIERIRIKREEFRMRVWGTIEKPDAETRNLLRIQRAKNYVKKRKIEDPAYYFIRVQRSRMHKFLKQDRYYLSPKHTDFTMKLLGVKTREEFLAHIQKHLKEGMTWENYGLGHGKWVLDHTIPIKYFKKNFDLINDFEIQCECFGIHNLRPMWWIDNAHKSAKLNYELK